MLAVLTVLFTALFLLARSELKSSHTYANQIETRNLADIAISLTIGQIRSGTGRQMEAWASQPGAIRKYDSSGEFLAGYKLYSDDDMIIGEESDFADDAPPENWQELDQHFVDLNAPSSRDNAVFYPIVDPRATFDVEGFGYDKSVSGTVAAESRTDANARLPMPVRWLYVLQDGTTGHLEETTNKFIGYRPDQNSSAVIPTRDNPIVGRIAFWADDETSKININTASEPTFWDVPRTAAREDLWYAHTQPVQNEYQRFPGHPATTALSTVLFGNVLERKTQAQLEHEDLAKLDQLALIKNAIYDIVPKVNSGGSNAGTVPTSLNDVYMNKDSDRLYASVDEFIMTPDRQQHVAEDGTVLIDRARLERSRFFLTASSEAPELNLFGLPRISMWPTDADEKNSYPRTGNWNPSQTFHTGFDQLIRFCSTSPSGDAYYFTRMDADHPTRDWAAIPRNREVYGYLDKLLRMNIPGVGESLGDKWGADRRQILTETFDYIRCTNLFDTNHPKLHYTNEENNRNLQTQFTNGRNYRGNSGNDGDENRNGVHHGHGLVMPIQVEVDGEETMGFGRYNTFSEYGFVFTTCAVAADRTNTLADSRNVANGGDSWIDPVSGERVFTNFPPLEPSPNPATFDWSPDYSASPSGDFIAAGHKPYPDWTNPSTGVTYDGRDPEHPGYKPKNWNHALPAWENWHNGSSTSGTTTDIHLKDGERIVQVCFVPEAYSVSQGWTGLSSRMQFEIQGLETLTLEGQSLYSDWHKNRRREIHGDLGGGFHGRIWGGSLGVRNCFDFDHSVSELVRVSSPSRGPLEFSGGTLSVKFFHTYNPDDLVQKHIIEFPSVDIPAPEMVDTGVSAGYGSSALSCRAWWGFNDCRSETRNAIDDPATIDVDESANNYDRTRSWGANWRGERDMNYYETHATDEYNERYWAHWWEGRVGRRTTGVGYPWTTANNGGDLGPYTVPNPTGSYRFGSGSLFRPEDTVRTMLPFPGSGSGGDMRLIMASKEVPSSFFKPGPAYFDLSEPIDHTYFVTAGQHFYHQFGNADLHLSPDGTYQSQHYPVSTQLTDGSYHMSKFPDFPRGYSTSSSGFVANSPILTGDFDNGVSLTPDGAFINKPDEGNRPDAGNRGGGFNSSSGLYAKYNAATPYFDHNWIDGISGPAYYSPNRQVPSPVMFGSLSTHVKRQESWKTLLFRPQPWNHPGARTPSDHYFLDLFWMPVVEPYAISEPFATAGKINMNYQLQPFTHIKRATGIHALMKAEEMVVIADEQGAYYKNWDHAFADYWTPELDADTRLRRLIDIDETLKQFDGRFSKNEIFRSATEICDIHLIPLLDSPIHQGMAAPMPISLKADGSNADAVMEDFWNDHSLTGDNSRERPYAHIYPRLTTKSNTYRVHIRAQAIRKKPFTDPSVFDPEEDFSVGEYRGSALIERYIDPNDKNVPDYTNPRTLSSLSDESMDRFYKFRVVHTKRFEQ